jgi:NAD(P)-dependent dehydrogenase (short-subunit alcohol dehydrogenase family)
MLEGRVAVVTGAGRGIGRGVALLMAQHGARVVVNDYGVSGDGRDPSSEPANEVVAEIKRNGGDAIAVATASRPWKAARAS